MTGKVLRGFRPETHGMEGIKKLVRKRFPEIHQLGTAELDAWMSDPSRTRPEILDVRTAEEFSVSHLPGARRVDPSASGPALEPLVATSGPVVLYCSVGYRSSALARRIIKAGRKNVSNLEGSVFQWANEGRPLINADGPAEKVHPNQNRWAALLRPVLRGEAD